MASEQELRKTKTSGEHVLLLPFMAQGHLIPTLALAKILDQRTPHTITILNTPLNIQRLRTSLPPNTTIQLSQLPFTPTDHGLPPSSENTDSLPPHLILPFIRASESLQPHLHRLLSSLCSAGRRPLCIISDEFMSWSVDSAREFGIFHSVFNTGGAYGSAIFFSVWTHLPYKNNTTIHAADEDEDEEFPLLDFPETTLRRSQLSESRRSSKEDDPWAVLFRKHLSFIERSDGMILNTVEELETKGMRHLRKNRWGRVWAIGPLIRPPSPLPIVETNCIEWLNQHPPASVVYISFGSQNTINLSQMMEMGKGLEESGKPFIWVIRPPTGFDLNDEFRAEEWLPEGFEERTAARKQGVLVKKWAPQMEILGHESTGAFLSHCGWNSVLESLSCGVPMIGWPMSAEQPFNSKLLEEELGVGVEMARWSKAEIRADEVARVIGVVMDGESEKGREMRRKAKEIAEVITRALVEEEGCKGSSIRAIEDFIQTALSNKEN
eukprot:TRINITY_DN7363_c0_g3_i1.p2 TRINITY_DN7363_c0_g3~~TRINITY_DN7363_c0_g3_i1.p2  ORF type:complete len:495 (-),score=100.54 TRINITY_DN7363_c0_g3_i1:139-1623(-)